MNDRLPTAPLDPETGNRLIRELLDAIHAVREHITPPPAPDDQVKAWRLFTGVEFGGVYCAEPDCGCEAEGSEIMPGGWPGQHEDDTAGLLTVAELHERVAEHIAHRAAVKEEEALF